MVGVVESFSAVLQLLCVTNRILLNRLDVPPEGGWLWNSEVPVFGVWSYLDLLDGDRHPARRSLFLGEAERSGSVDGEELSFFGRNCYGGHGWGFMLGAGSQHNLSIVHPLESSTVELLAWQGFEAILNEVVSAGIPII